MEVFEALKYLGFDKIEGVDTQTIKKRYRELSKENHPDLGGDSEKFRLITESKDVLERYIRNVEKIKRMCKANKSHTAIVTLEELLGMYHGKTKQLGNDYELTASNLKSNNIFIAIKCSITLDDVQVTKEIATPYRIDDNYKLFCRIPDSDINAERSLRIILNDKDIRSVMGKASKIFSINFENLVHITLQIERVQQETKENAN